MATDSVSENLDTEQVSKTLSTLHEYKELLNTGTYIIQALEELNKHVEALNRLANRFSEIAKKICNEKS